MSDIRLYEVTPRDGLQNESQTVSTTAKLQLIEKLVAAGYKDIEVTSFVKPSWIPQLADGDQLLRMLPQVDGVRYWSLIPNRRGLDRALDVGVKNIATFMSASATHNRKNLNRTKTESLQNLKEVISIAKSEQMQIRAYLSTVFGCPYEGSIPIQTSLDLAMQLLEFGADEIALGDTTGMGNPTLIQQTISTFVEHGIPLEQLSLHLHDTRGTALANAYAGYLAGIRSFDGSTAGVGGCPYAPGASGNAASEDLLYMFESMGLKTGVDLSKAADVGVFLASILQKKLSGRYHQYHRGIEQQNKNTA